MLEIELPFPPSVNHLYRRFRSRVVLSSEGRAYRDTVASALAALGVRPLAGPLEVEIDLYPPDRRRRDADNPIKILADSLQHGGAFEDDSQIVRLVVEKKDPVPGGRAIVRIGVRIPSSSSAKEKELLRQYAEATGAPVGKPGVAEKAKKLFS